MRIADIGAETGLFVGLFAEVVGREGRVYAVEISPGFAEHLRKQAVAEGLTQVEMKRNGPRSTALDEAVVDVVFLCDAYHHFEYPKEMLLSIQRALRPGGQLVLVDIERIPGKSRGGSRTSEPLWSSYPPASAGRCRVSPSLLPEGAAGARS